MTSTKLLPQQARQARRLANTTVLVRVLPNGRIVIERNGQQLPTRLLARKTNAATIIGAKVLAQLPTLKRPDHPEKAHRPKPTHPWKTYRHAPKGDISTEFAGDITA